MVFSLLSSSWSPAWPCDAVGPSSVHHLASLHSGQSSQKWQETLFQPCGKDSAFFRKGSSCAEALRLRRAHTSQVISTSYSCLLPSRKATLWHGLSTGRMDLRMEMFNEKPWFRCPLRSTPVLMLLFCIPSILFFTPASNGFCGGA